MWKQYQIFCIWRRQYISLTAADLFVPTNNTYPFITWFQNKSEKRNISSDTSIKEKSIWLKTSSLHKRWPVTDPTSTGVPQTHLGRGPRLQHFGHSQQRRDEPMAGRRQPAPRSNTSQASLSTGAAQPLPPQQLLQLLDQLSKFWIAGYCRAVLQ